MPLAYIESSTHRVGLYHDPHSSRWETDWYRPPLAEPLRRTSLKRLPTATSPYLDAAAKGPAVFDEHECKAADRSLFMRELEPIGQSRPEGATAPVQGREQGEWVIGRAISA